MTEPLDVLCVGNAIVDVLASVPDELLERHGLVKGEMRLVDTDGAERLYADIPPAVEASGGSAGNTAAGVASLGGAAGYVGKVADDELGAVYTHDIRAAGVEFTTPPLVGGLPTARSMIVVTPDANRTMSTYLGAANLLTVDDIDETQVARAKVTYLEGYLWDPPEAKEAFRKAMDTAHANGQLAALTLSDAFCVDRFRDEFIDLVDNHVDLLFCNESELLSLYQVDDFDTALAKVRGRASIAAVTRSERGSVLVQGDDVYDVPAEPTELVDTTGAGDLYAAGVLFGLSRGKPLDECGRIGSIAAAECISHMGARPLVQLSTL
ncbi:MAG: adenosine kinase, partial [Actinobacteria bacterium]|nr:adenosine kinase [Actinomycetota bacterium]